MGDEERAERTPERGEEREGVMRELDKERRARVAKITVALVLAVLFILFIIRNSSPVSESDEGVDFLFYTADVRLIWVFLVCALVGGIVGYLLGRPSKTQRHLLRRSHRAGGTEEDPGSSRPDAATR